jgi:hypothetical protein
MLVARDMLAEPSLSERTAITTRPDTVDTTTNTLYLGTAAAAPEYYPSLRPVSDPREDSVVAVDLATDELKWCQRQLAFNEWAYDIVVSATGSRLRACPGAACSSAAPRPSAHPGKRRLSVR